MKCYQTREITLKNHVNKARDKSKYSSAHWIWMLGEERKNRLWLWGIVFFSSAVTGFGILLLANRSYFIFVHTFSGSFLSLVIKPDTSRDACSCIASATLCMNNNQNLI